MKQNKIIIIFALFLIAAFTAVTFAPSLENDFTNWDDPDFITENPDIKELSPVNIKRFFTTSYRGFGGYVPFVMLSYAVEHHYFGLNPRAYHTTNLILHILNTLLVFWFIHLISGKLSVSFITSILFGIHPLHVESVAWIQGRKDLLFALFFLAALIAYTLYLQKGRKKIFYLMTLVFFLFSLFSKVMAISLPLVLIVLELYLLRKIDKETLRNKLPFFLLPVVFLVLALATSESTFASLQGEGRHYLENLALFFYAFVFYLTKIFLPAALSARYSLSISQLFPGIILSLLLFLVISILIYFLYKVKKNEVTFGIVFFAVTLLPALFFQFVGQPYADRYTYIPLLGIFFTAGMFFQYIFCEKFMENRKIKISLLVFFLGIGVALAAVTRSRCPAWKDSLTLWNNVLATNKTDSLAYLNRGEYLLREGKVNPAMADFHQSVKHNPNNTYAYNNRGIVYFGRQEYKKALLEYTRALTLNPSYFNAYMNRGNLWGRLKQFPRAINDYGSALKLKPSSRQVLYYRGITYMKMGRPAPAIVDFSRILAMHPNDTATYLERGKAFLDKEDADAAVEDFGRVIRLEPANALAWFQRGKAYLLLENAGSAARDFRESIRLKPGVPAPYYGLLEVYKKKPAALYTGKSPEEEAVKICRQLLQIAPTPEVHNQLGEILLKLGRKKEAQQAFEKASTR